MIGREAGVARVRVQRSGGCGRCHEEGGCGNTADSRCDEFVVLSEFDVKLGDKVRIVVPEGAALRAALLAYGLPLAGLLIGAALGFLLAGTDLACVLGGGVGLGAGLLALRMGRHRGAARPRVAAIL